MIHAVSQTDLLEHILGQLLPLFARVLVAAIIHQWQHHVAQCSGASQQVVRLEDIADLGVANSSQLVFIQVADILPVQAIFTGSGGGETTQDVHQGALAGTGWPHDGDQFTGLHLQADVVQRRHTGIPHAVALGQFRG